MKYITTKSGRKVYPLSPEADQIHIDDIAHGLSNVCRFNGHTSSFFSVARHSINVAKRVLGEGADANTALKALLHDASEAYLCDIPTPVKEQITGYKESEEKMMRVIFEAFRLGWFTREESVVIGYWDLFECRRESRYFMDKSQIAPRDWPGLLKRLGDCRNLKDSSVSGQDRYDFIEYFNSLWEIKRKEEDGR